MTTIKNFALIILVLLMFLFWYQPAIAPDSPAVPPPQETTIIAVGDILLSRNVGAKIEQAQNPHLPFEKLRDLLSSADLTFGNLECPLSDSDIPVREGLVFRCLTKYVPGLLNAGFDVLSTANNHALDQGTAAVSFTRDFLISQNILPVGTGRNQEEAWKPAILDVAEAFRPPSQADESARYKTVARPFMGSRVAFLAASYASHNDGGKSRNDYVARIEDLDILKSKILNLKSNGHFVIVSMHAGTEYTRYPNQEQIDFAHAAIDAGADVVLGHHPHWIQEIEIYPPLSPPAPNELPPLSSLSPGGRGEGEGEIHHGLIFYSLGNFVFDQSWSQETREGLVVKLNIKDQKLKSAELLPVIIESNCCPRLATEEEKAAILNKINLESDTIELSLP